MGFADLGMEAIYEFDVVDMPVTVAVDAGGTSAHITGPAEWQKKIATGEFKNIPVAAADVWRALAAVESGMDRRPIGVFDSGVGGLSVLRALRAELPREDFVYFADAGHAPYGERGDAFVVERSLRDRASTCWSSTASRRWWWPATPPPPRPSTCCAREHPRAAAWWASSRRSSPRWRSAGPGASACSPRAARCASAKFAALHDSLRGQAEFVLQPCDGLAAAIEADDAARRSRALCARYTRERVLLRHRAGQIDTAGAGLHALPVCRRRTCRLAAGQAVQLVEPASRWRGRRGACWRRRRC